MPQSASNGGNASNGTRFAEDDSAASKPSYAAGTVIKGKYRLELLIGEGGMGTVWRAQHLQLDLPVAIKLLRAGADRTELAARMQIEARAAARLAHPAIVRVFDIDTTEGDEPFIVMELLDGESLSDVLDRGPLAAIKAVQTLLPIAEALVLAHQKGILHRDLKPHNIMLSPRGEHLQPKLLDFGIAKLTTSPLPSGSLTDTGVALGSPDYMSPEQARGSSDVDHRADIWQLCVVLYESITTQTPFAGDNYNALMRAIVEDEPQPLALGGEVDERLVELVTWGLRKKREERPASMEALAKALAEWLIAHGVDQDASGGSLASRWLVERSHDSSSKASGVEPQAEPLRVPRARLGAAWLALGALGAAACVAWLVARGNPSHREPERASIATERAFTNPPPPQPGAALIAPAQASVAANPLAAPSSSASISAPRKNAPAVPSGRVVHDETKELLQAY